jgi:hypothetical protein
LQPSADSLADLGSANDDEVLIHVRYASINKMKGRPCPHERFQIEAVQQPAAGEPAAGA